MDNNNWRAAQGQVQIPGQVMGGEAVAAAGVEGGDWRTQLQNDSRHRIVNKIMDTLKRHLPFSGQEGLQELKKIAVRFEEKIYAAATSQSDYLRKISLKMLTMETKSQNPMTNSLQSNGGGSKNPQDPAVSQSMQSQLQNQVQQPSIPISSQPQVRQQLLSQSIQNNIASTGLPNSAGLTSALPTVGGMSQGAMPNVPGTNPNMQNMHNMSNVNPNAVGNSLGQGVPSNIYANSQRQIQVRQQQVVNQEQQQPSQNSQYFYNQHLQQQIIKQKLQQGGVQQSIMQSQIQQQQQQNLMQQNQLQSSQQAVMQPSLRQTSTSSTLQNQQSSLQQSTQSMLQQQSQSVLRQQQQQPQQPSVMHQQQTSMPQHSMLPTQQQQQQQLSGVQSNTANMQQNQLIGQSNSILEAQQQQRMVTQQNNISNMQPQQTISQQNNLANMHQRQSTGQQNSIPTIHQQQLGPQSNHPGFQQQQLVGIHGNSSLQTNQPPVHMIQQGKVSAQQQMQHSMATMLPNQAQQQQSQPMQQQLMSQIQSQQGQLQQPVGVQQKGTALPRDMQQRIQTSSPMHQQQTTIDQQKQLLQSERGVPEVPPTSLDSSSQTSNVSSGDWQEEIYQKIKSMYELFFPELNEMHQRMAVKLQQHDAHPQQPKNDQVDKLRFFKVMLERLIMFLQTKKQDIQPTHKEKIPAIHKQIVNILTSHRPRKNVSSLQQGQLAQPHSHAMQQSQQQQPQISQMHMNDGQMNSQMQATNVQGSVGTTQQNTLNSLQHNSLSSVSSVQNSRQSMMDALQPGSNVDPGQGTALNQLQQVAMNSLQQNTVSSPQQMNINSMSSQGGLATMQPNGNTLQTNSNILQPQQIKQEQPMFSTQQMKQQYPQRQMQQQFMHHRQQLIQQQSSAQIPTQQMMQHNQMHDTNEMKMRHQLGGKSGVIQSHSSSGQRPYHHQQMKPGTPLSISPQQALQPASPQIGRHTSPQIDQPNLLASHAKAAPLQSANSPFIVPPSSTSMASSPMPGGSEKISHGVSPLSNSGNIVHHSTTAASLPNQSLAIGTPGISASPLLAEFTSPDGTHGVTSTIVSGNSNVVEQPLERLTKVVKSMSSKALSASVSDISSVVSMVDRIAGSAPGNGSRAAVGEDLVAMTKCRLQARNFFTQDGPSGTKKMRRYTSAMPSNVVSSTGSVNDKHLNGNESDGESTGASSCKRPRIEANHALEEELREINQRLIDTVVYISEDDVDPTAVATATEGGEGTIVKCSFSAVALSPNLKSQYASAQMSPIQPLRLLIPNNYPNCSPILLDKFPVEVSKEYEDLSIKAKSRFSIFLRSLAQPMSIGEIARTWDNCARGVISEYVEQSGGGSFSSKYGTWENRLTAV